MVLIASRWLAAQIHPVARGRIKPSHLLIALMSKRWFARKHPRPGELANEFGQEPTGSGLRLRRNVNISKVLRQELAVGGGRAGRFFAKIRLRKCVFECSSGLLN